MFKLESYITPIIMNQVAKYVKNIRPQDAQVSLWEGEVAFQNVDLRLEVLEEELNLPFEFLSGHIHELIINVPWLKIAVEPIVIDINTIEFVLKLKDPNKTSSTQQLKKIESKKEKSDDVINPGLLYNLINNIVIKCHNIILKYVEDDIVVSMNIQHLSINSANEKWVPAFIDVGSSELLKRKLIKISDLTICLDKRNSDGLIEVCQEPIMYRCTLEIRIINSYKFASKADNSTTRIGIFSKLIEINTSSLQFPMLMRLFNLITTLQEGHLKKNMQTESDDDQQQDNHDINDSNKSFFSSLWSYLPTITIYFDDDTNRDSEQKGHILDIGIYIENLQFTLKFSEFITDTFVSTTKKLRYSPIFKIGLNGIYAESVIINDLDWESRKGGVSGIYLEPLGIYNDTTQDSNYLFYTNLVASNKYLENSIFDENIQNGFVPTKYITDIKAYQTYFTDLYLKYRSPAVAFDIVSMNNSDAISIVDDKSVKSLIRIIITSIIIRYNHTVWLALIKDIKDLIKTYDYPPYCNSASENDIPKLHPPSLDDFDALMNEIPLKMIRFQLQSITAEIYTKSLNRNQTLKEQKSTIPFLSFSINDIIGQLTTPLDPIKLVHTTCQLPDKPVELTNNCYQNYKFSIASFEGGIRTHDNKILNKLIKIPKTNGVFKTLLLPELWNDKTISKIQFQISIDKLILCFTKPQYIILMNISENLIKCNEKSIKRMLQSTALNDLNNSAMTLLDICITKISFDMEAFGKKIDTKGQITTIQSVFKNFNEQSQFFVSKTIPFFQTTSNKLKEEPWFQWKISLNEFFPPSSFSVISVWMNSFTWVMDSNAVDYINYESNTLEQSCEDFDDNETENTSTNKAEQQVVLRKTSRLSLNSERTHSKFTRQETIHLSSEKEEAKEIIEDHVVENIDSRNEEFLLKLLQISKTLMIYIEISQGYIYLCGDEAILLPPPMSSLIILPNVVCKSALTEGINRYSDINLPVYNKPTKNLLPWTCNIKDFSIKCFKAVDSHTFVHDAHTTITVALNYKKETLIKGEKESSDDTQKINSESKDKIQAATSKKKGKPEREFMSMSLHIDTSPFCIDMSSDIVTIVADNINMINDVLEVIRDKNDEKCKMPAHKNLNMMKQLEDSENIKDFLESDNYTYSNSIKTQAVPKMFSSFLIQWTITKVQISLESSPSVKSKLVLEVEDLITTIDNRRDFVKYTCKIGTLNANYYQLNSKQEWTINNSLKIKMSTDSAQSLLNVIITTVSLREFYQKIGVKKIGDKNRSITEIVINMRAIDVIIDLDKITDFMTYICAIPLSTSEDNLNEHITNDGQVDDNMFDSVDYLPMLHFDCRGLQLYMPVQTGVDYCSVIIFKIEEIKISPNLENPLQRTPVRQDIFNKAAELGILNIQGSIVEDRQYEIIFQSMSTATGNWDSIVQHMNKNSNSVHNLVSSNPAFEWNNQIKKPSLVLQDIFNNFTFIITIAPSIVFNNILICGKSTEFNCSTDLICEVTTDQIILFNCIGNRIEHIYGSMCKRPFTNWQKRKVSHFNTNLFPKTNFEKSKIFTTQSATDSGIGSMNNKTCLPKPINIPVINLPYTISFVSGIFHIKFFKYIRKEIYVVEEEAKKTEETIIPLISLTVNQPTFIITQNMYDKSIRFSLFDLIIHLGRNVANTLSEHDMPSNQFPTAIAYTQRGKICNSGFSPSLVNITINLTKLKKSEIDIEISKPTIIHISEHIIEHFTKLSLILYQSFLTNACYKPKPIPVYHGSKVEMIRSKFFNADHFNIKTDSVVIKLFKKKSYYVKVAFIDIMALLSFTKRPDKFNLKGSINGLYIQTDKKILLHPVGFRLNLDLTDQLYRAMPTTNANIRFNVIQVDVGVRNVEQLKMCYNGFSKSLALAEKQWNTFLEKNTEYLQEDITLYNREKIFLPPPGKKFKKLEKDELYQDDLRAGAFQFIEMTTDNILPMPYQIQIIKKNYGIICWRYPQPRKVRNVYIFPVPMTVPMASTKPINIKCSMEYYSEVNELFLHFTDFWLSENEAKTIKLPDRLITACIWRVVIMQSLVTVNGECFDTSEEEEDLSSIQHFKINDFLNAKNEDKDFILHPKVLVGCMRVDTLFNGLLAPKMQFVISADAIHINLQNQQTENSELPTIVKKYKSTSSLYADQTFISIVTSNSKFYGSFLKKKSYNFETNLTFRIECLDYGYLNMLPLCEESNINAYLSSDDTNTTDASVIIDKIKINFGLSMLHSLLVSKLNWHDHMYNFNTNKRTILTRFVIINRTNFILLVGQSGTQEKIQLNPKACMMYSFQSDYFDQNLSFYLLNEKLKIIGTSAPVFISTDFKFLDEKDYYLRNVLLDDKFLIIVKVKKLSTTQIAIFIKGQIELISMVKDQFRLQFREETENLNNQITLISDHLVESNDKLTFIQTIKTKDNITIRLKLFNQNGKGWTGDIPLRPNKNLPWLVKVPITDSEGFITYWVRIIREDITELTLNNNDNIMQKVLISIWPIFEICSMLTCTLNITESVTKNTFDIQPAGKRYALQVPATHQTVHEIKINNMCSSSLPEKDSFNLTLKSFDWNKFFWYNVDTYGVESTLEILRLSDTSQWPLTNELEKRITRKAQLKMPTSVNFKCNKSRFLGCTLSLEICPWALIINSIGEKIALKYPEFDERLQIESQNIEMMLEVKSYFVIQISDGPSFIDSLPIYLNSDLCKHIPETERYLITENGHISIVINAQHFVYKLCIYWESKNSFPVFIIEPKFVVTNFTNLNLFVTPFSLAEKETTNREVINSLNINQIILPINENTDNSIGIPLDYFCDIYAKIYNRDMHTNFVFFVCFKVDTNCEISIPIPLGKTYSRRCFNLQCKDRSIPLSVNSLERNGIYYLNVFHDHHSLVYIKNQTKLSFLIAETEAHDQCSNVPVVIPEYEFDHFKWIQIIRPLSELYYTPPTVYNKFPNIQPVLPNLTIAIFKEDTKDVIKWSKVISIDKSYEKFIHVANHGDVKIIVCDKHKIIKLTICYIAQQLEFSVKDLRSRILKTEGSFEEIHSIDEFDNKLSKDNVQLVQSTDSLKCQHQITDKPKSIRIRVFVNEISCNLSIHSSSKQYLKKEIIALYIDDLMFNFDMYNRKMDLTINNLQIDNQLYSNGNYDFPVLLCSRDLYKKTSNLPSIYELPNCVELSKNNPMIHIGISFFIDEWEFRNISCNFQPMRAYIEDSYVHYIYKVFVAISPNNAVYLGKKEQSGQDLTAGTVLIPTDIVKQAFYLSEPIKLDCIHIKPMNVLLSVHSSIRMYIALDHSPLDFSSYRKQNVLSLPLSLGHSVGRHYFSGALFGAGWVVGSLEMLGSPSGLARSFTIGLRDFVSMPVQGLLRGPWGFLVGITQGSASLIRNVTAGTVNSVTKLAGSVSRNLDRLTLDKEHIERTDALRRSRPQGFTEGFAQGITGLGINILGAVGGIARHTLEAKSPGQVVTGVGKGIFGALAKPISGAAELVSLTGQGMLHSVGFNTMPKQRSPSTLKNIAIGPSDSKIWKLLPHVLVTDQILFKHDVTLIRPEGLKMSAIYLTSTVLACMDMSKNTLEHVLQIDSVNAFFDQNDRTIIHIKYREPTESDTQEESYTSQRIMNFLRASTSNSDIPDLCFDSLHDLLTKDTETTKKPQWSFYINEHMGRHLLQYLKVINCKID